jgi:AraC-like DNA-binding protein
MKSQKLQVRDRITQKVEILTTRIERTTAFIQGTPFDTHRHEGFIVGVTTTGVQHFNFRRQQWNAAAGQAFMLPPDEPHDGYAGAREGFGYSAACVDPELIQQANGYQSLPCLIRPLLNLSFHQMQSLAPLWQFGTVLHEADIADAVTTLVDILRPTLGHSRALPLTALAKAKEFIRAAPHRPLALSELEDVSGLDRWSLARSFRQAYGVSPTRYRTMRQLALVRRLLTAGESLAAASNDAGFADQNHMTRKFKSAFGVTPGLWRSATRSPLHKRSI